MPGPLPDPEGPTGFQIEVEAAPPLDFEAAPPPGTEAAHSAPEARPRFWRRVDPRWRLFAMRLAGALAVMLLALLLLLNTNWLRHLGNYGYLGVFVLSLLSNATIVIPAPGWLIPIVAGSTMNPLLVGLAAGTGQALGELTGYLAGASGTVMIEDSARYEWLSHLVRRYGLGLISLLAFIPNPLFDLAGIISGALRIPVLAFLLATWIGKTLRATMFAYGGYGFFDRFLKL